MRGANGRLLLTVLLACVWPAIGLAAPAIPAVIAQVQTALDRGDAVHAASLAEDALREKDISATERARLRLYHGLAEELLGVRETATQDFTAALDSHALPPEQRAQALLQRGFLRDGDGKLNEAIADYSAVIAMKGEGLATALNNRANVYRRQNRFDAAKRDYHAAFGAGSKGQYIWYGLGQIAEAQKDIPTARDYYARAIIVDPNYALASERLAALGGAPDSVVASPQAPIVLKPPAQETGGTMQPGAQPAGADSPGIALRPALDQSATASAPDETVKAAVPDQTAKPAKPDRSVSRSVPDQSAKGEVQLGAFRSEAEAKDGWTKAQAQAGAILAGHQSRVVVADLPGKGRYYRLRIGPPAGMSPRQFCDSLTAKGVGCFPVRD
jgi:tetratricopeptide (TPR) repeat protein